MKKPFFARHALFVLMVVFFFVPFALRGSRYAVQRMKNDVKDWLPTDFPETAELDWFRQRFLGEQFVVISWEGCRGTVDDEAFQTFVDKLFPELPPSVLQAGVRKPGREEYVDQDLGLYARSYMPADPAEMEDFIGNQLSLRMADEVYEDWGGRGEKWMRSGRDDWVYLTPEGELYQWMGNRTWPARLWRGLHRAAVGKQQVDGDFIASLGDVDGPWYFEDPRRLTARLFKSVTTGPSVLSDMTREDGDLNIEMADAHDRLRGLFFGPDDQQTCIVVTLTEAGKEDPRALLGRGMLGKPRGALLDIAEESGVQPPAAPPAVPPFLAGLYPQPAPSSLPMLRLGGPLVDNAAIDEEGQITLVRLLGLSLFVGLGLSWICFRSINITIMVFLVGGISAVVSVGLVHWSGSQLDAVLMSMPSLVYVLGISGAVHIVNYYRESVAEHGVASAPDRAVRLGLWPCTTAAFTTSLGLISLSASNIIPIRKFGFFSAVGVAATLILLFTYLPAALATWPPRRYKSLSKTGQDASSRFERMLDRFWQGVGHFVIKRYRLVAVVCLIAFVFLGVGLGRVDTDIQLLKLFDKDAKIIQDYEWLEANLGKLVPMEVVVRVDPRLQANEVDSEQPNAEVDEKLQLSFLERMELVQFASDEIDRVFGESGKQYMTHPMSAATFANLRDAHTRHWGMRSGISKQHAEKRQAFVDLDFLRTDPDTGHELWRMSLRLAALSDIQFGEFVDQIKAVLEPMLLAYEYRQEILQRLDDQRTLTSAPVIYLVGIPEESSAASPSALNPAEPEIDQTRIFWETTRRLLRGARFRLAKLASPEALAQLKSSDTVVVFQDDPLLPMGDLQATGVSLIDARNHGFDPHEDTTAMQEDRMVSAVYTGLVPVVYKAQSMLLVSLFESTGWAFVMIAIVMILLLRSFSAGLLSMLPNVFPVVAIFGVMGWLRVKVDIGSMMTASVAMGVAVDDTIHFLSWFRRGLDAGNSRKQAILLAYRRVATAMTQTTAIGGVGLSIFAFSTFTPTQRFGTLMLALLLAALIGDLLFLPALLASPLGKVFDRQRRKRDESASTLAESVDGEPPREAATPHSGKVGSRRRSGRSSEHR